MSSRSAYTTSQVPVQLGTRMRPYLNPEVPEIANGLTI